MEEQAVQHGNAELHHTIVFTWVPPRSSFHITSRYPLVGSPIY